MDLAKSMPTWLGWAIAAAVAIAAILRDKRKGDIDESALVLGKWKELVEQHQSDIRSIKDEFAVYKATAIAEIGDLRARLVKAEARITELETENAGLKRAIAQNSQSTAYQLGRSSRRAGAGEVRMTGMQDEITALDLAGHNLKGVAE
ncbi:MAG TPA: hypothetical protein VF637_01035 [Sphingomicrobium sp.]|jgi:hypothetical protein